MAAGQINFTDVYFTQLQVAICIPGGWGGVLWGRKTRCQLKHVIGETVFAICLVSSFLMLDFCIICRHPYVSATLDLAISGARR